MRRQRLLRASSSHTLCIFCASRLLGPSAVAPITSQRRPLNTTRSPHQSAAAAAAPAPEQENNGNGNSNAPQRPNWSGFDVDSSLTPAEQAEVQRRRQQRLQKEQEQERQAIADMERRAEARKAVEAQQARERAAEGERQARVRRGEVERKAKERAAEEEKRVRDNTFRANAVPQVSSAERERIRREKRRDQPRNTEVVDAGKARHQDRRMTRSQASAVKEPASKRKNPLPRKQQQKVSMPSFGLGGGGDDVAERETAGWGSSDETKPLQPYEEGDERFVEEAEGFRAAEEVGESRSNQDIAPAAGLYDNRSKDSLRFQQQDQRDDPQNFGSMEQPHEQQSPYQRRFQPRQSNPNVIDHHVTDPRYTNDYRATPFNAAEYQPNRCDEQHADNWQHLPRRNSAPSASQVQQQQQQPSRQRTSPFDDSDYIDRQFREHQRQRVTRNFNRFVGPGPQGQTPEGQYNPNIQDAKSLFAGRTEQVCARCQQKGHVARNCTNQPAASPKVKCRRCGGMGHFDRDCPIRGAGAGPVRRTESVGATDTPFSQRQIAQAAYQKEGGVEFRDVRFQPQDKNSEPSMPAFQDKQTDREQVQPVQAPDEDVSDRRAARRSRRGFEDGGESEVEQTYERKGRRNDRRAFENTRELDEEAADEAAYQREQRAARKAARNAARKADRVRTSQDNATPISLPEFVSVSNLAQTLGVRYEAFVQRLEDLGYGEDVFPGQVLDREISGMIAMEYNYEPSFEGTGSSAANTEEEERDLKAAPEVAAEDKEYLPTRPPVVTIMGHVDHGKTTILDFLRKSSVAAGEAGGITQHIGAFSVPMSSSGKTITFLDTPGHAAFLAMRQRGANVTDIVILVVAADDSVKPQTLESIRCAREAGVPMIVAVNKVDKEEADVQRVKQDLSRHGVEIEDFGGEVQVVPVSGKTGMGMEELEEAIVTLSEILDQRADAVGSVEGWVLESSTKRAGRVATVLIKRGTLRPGAVLVAGTTWARVRTLRNEAGIVVPEVGAGMPVEVDGWREQAVAGDEVLQAPSEQKAGSVVDFRREKEERLKTAEDMTAINESRRLDQERRARERAAELAEEQGITLPTAANTAESDTIEDDKTGGQITVPFIIKADVSGSAEALNAYIPSLTSPLIVPQILSSTVGPINESDVELASAAQGHIITFNLPKQEDMAGLAGSKGVKVLENNVIYRVLDDVKAVLEARLPEVVVERVLGEAEVSAGFEIGLGGRKKMKIAGCKVRNGVIAKNARVRISRNGEKVYDGTINSLKNVKKDVQEMRKGTECGMGFEEWEGFEVGDVVQTYEEIREKRKL